MASFVCVVWLTVLLANFFVRGDDSVLSVVQPSSKDAEESTLEDFRSKRHLVLRSSLNAEFQAYLQSRFPPDKTVRDVNTEDFLFRANSLASVEFLNLLGSSIPLDEAETKANKIVTSRKFKEYDKVLNSSEIFPPSRNFLLAKDLIEQSEMFEIIKKMPKGASLYTILVAAVPQEFLYRLTFENDLYFRLKDRLEFRFSKKQPGPDWKLLSELRNSGDSENLDQMLRENLILPSPGANRSTPTLEDVLSTYRSLMSYKPTFEKTFKAALETLYEDGIMYAELYYDFPEIYDLDGKTYTPHETVQLCRALLDVFAKSHEGFIGIRFVYAPAEPLTLENLGRFREASTALWLANPDFVAGFGDTIRGETQTPYSDLLEEFLKFPKEMKLFLDGGLTINWGTGADRDLINCLNLDSSTIGAAISLSKHPVFIDQIRAKGVAVKSSPTASQVLGAAPDLRNHPLTILVALDAPMVIASVAGTAWNATGLSYDFYEAYMAMTPRFCDIRCLKQFALNSLLYSTLPKEVKWASLEAWQIKWNEFIGYLISNYD